MVLANNSEHVLLPVNEPTIGTARKSQIQTYLEHNAGAGVQHLALKTDNIFKTLRRMRDATHAGGFDFMSRTSPEYYQCALNCRPSWRVPGQYLPGVDTWLPRCHVCV